MGVVWTPPLDFVSSLNYLKFGWSWSWRLSCHPVSSSHPSSVQYLRRRKSALWVTVALLALALVVLTIGLISATRTDNVPVAGYYPGITVSHTSCSRPLKHSTGVCCILLYTLMFFFSSTFISLYLQLSFGAFLGIVGIHLVENRRPMVSLLLRGIICSSYVHGCHFGSCRLIYFAKEKRGKNSEKEKRQHSHNL